jgi:hypothetical protein
MGPTSTITNYKIWRGVTDGVVDTLVATIAAVSPAFDQDVYWTDTGAAGTTGAFPVINTTFGRTSDVTILGGVWNVNKAVNLSGGVEGWQGDRYVGHGLNLQKIDNFTLRGVKVTNAFKWAIAIADFTNLVTDDIEFNTGSDGIHVLGPGSGWRGRGFHGHVGDDLVGLSLVEWPNETPSEGDITGVELSGLRGVDAPSAVRMLMGSGRKFDNIRISDVSGEYTYYRDALTDAYTTTAVGVMFLNADNNNPGRKGGSFGRVDFSNIRPDSHFSDVVQIDGTGDSININGLRNMQSARYGVRFGAATYDSTRPTAIKKAVVMDATATHTNAARAVYAAQTNTAIDDLIIHRPTVNQSGASNSLPVEISTGVTVKRLKVHDPVCVQGTANGIDLVTLTGAIVTDILVTGAVAELLNSIVYLNGGTYSKVAVRDSRAKTVQALVKAKQPVAITLSNNDADTVSSGAVALFTSSATPVSIEASGNRYTSAPGLSKDGSQVVTAGSLTTQCDVSKLTKTANTMAYNTNSGLSCGAGPVVCDGTNWKHLFTGATY